MHWKKISLHLFDHQYSANVSAIAEISDNRHASNLQAQSTWDVLDR